MHKAGTRYLDKTAAAFSLQSADCSVSGWCPRSPQIDWGVRQLDVKTASLHVDIEEKVFVAESPGFKTNDNEKRLLVIGKASMGWLKALE